MHAGFHLLILLQTLILTDLWTHDIFLAPFVMPQMNLCTTLHVTLASHWAHNEDALEKIICDYVSDLGEYFPAVKTLVIGNDGFPWDLYVSC